MTITIKNDRYYVSIFSKGENHCIGGFTTPDEAVLAEHEASLKIIGPHYLPRKMHRLGGGYYLDARFQRQYATLAAAQLGRLKHRTASFYGTPLSDWDSRITFLSDGASVD